jgi:sugar O-acyltransferase (sialic acid O-acetyltransferase NeuD family)
MGAACISPSSVVVLGLESRYGFEVIDLLAAARVDVRACMHSAHDSECAGPYPDLISHSDASSCRGAEFVVPLLTPGRRKQRANEGTDLGMRAGGPVVHPKSVISGSTRIGPGGLVGALAVIGAHVTCGSFFMANRVASIGHDCTFGDFCTVGPAATICGSCVLEDGVYVGAGAVLLPKVRIGRNAVIAAGAVVTRDVASHSTVAGNPARVVRENIAGYRDIGV